MGGRAIHCAPQTRSRIIHKMVRNGGLDSKDRSVVEILNGCRRAATQVECEALLLTDDSSADMMPQFEVAEPSAQVHQSTRSVKLDSDEIAHLQGRELSREEALAMRTRDFLESFTRRLPKEYAVEVIHWIELAMEGSVG
jgi:Fe-S cluster assembly protein SufB